MEFPATTAQLQNLPSGLTAILDPIDDSEVISTQIWVETGSQHESALAGSGISHLLEHMVFKGTDRFSGEELSQVVQAAGGQWNAYTSFDRTVYYIDGPAKSLELFLSALIEMVFRPLFPESEFEKEKEVIRREIAMGKDDPDSVSSELLFHTCFQRDHRRHPVIGHLDLFNAITYEEMKNYHASRYRPHQAFLVISGGFCPNQATELINLELAKGLRPPASFPVTLPKEPRQMGERRISQHFSIPSTHLSMTWQIPDLTHQDTPALDLLSVVLGGGRASPLYQIIREQEDLAHSIGAYAWAPADGPGIFSVSAELDSQNAQKIEEEVWKIIRSVENMDLKQPLARAFRQLASQQFKTLATASGRASDLASNWHCARDLNYTRTALSKLSEVSESDLIEVTKKYLTPQGLTVTSLVPSSEALHVPQVNLKKARSEVLEHTLSNGLRVLLQRDPSIPVVYGQTALLAGCLSESSSKAGINDVLASLLLKGTRHRSALAIAESLESLGASIRASTGNNSTMISSYCLSSDLEPVIDLFGEIIREPAFPEESLERERASLITRLEESLEDPATRAFREMRTNLWGGQGYGHHSAGTIKSLKQITREDLLAHHKQYFCASNSVTAFFGDLEPDKTLAALENSFQSLPVGSAFSTSKPDPVFSGEHHLCLKKEQAVLVIGYPAIAQNDPRRFALELIDSYCSDMAGPLFSRIREDLGLAYYVGSSIFFGMNTGLASFYLGTSPEQLKLAETEIQKEIVKLIENGIPEDALKRVKANTEARDALRNQSLSSRVRMATLDVLLGYPANHHQLHSERLSQVTKEETQQVCGEIFHPETAMTIRISPEDLGIEA